MLEELWLIPRLFASVGWTLVPLHSWLPQLVQLAAADIVLVGAYGPREDLDAAIRRYPQAAFVFVLGENVPDTNYYYGDHVVPGARISMGLRADQAAAAASGGSRSLRIPWWLPYTLDRSQTGCRLPRSLTEPADPVKWAARPKFAALLSSHYNYPRRELHSMLAARGRVDCPGGAFHNMEWPASLPNNHLDAKVAFLRDYRFNACPENSLSTRAPGKGYNTEKVTQALIAGTVPLYWGDELEAEVWNPARILRFNGSVADIAEKVRQLETNETRRREFFSQPAVHAGAQAFVDVWCSTAAAHFAWVGDLVRQRSTQRPTGTVAEARTAASPHP